MTGIARYLYCKTEFIFPEGRGSAASQLLIAKGLIPLDPPHFPDSHAPTMPHVDALQGLDF